MPTPVPPLLTIGLVLLGALVIHDLAPRIGLPRVTLLMLFGVAIGPVGLDALPDEGPWLQTATDVALTMIGLLLGGEFTVRALREHGKDDLLLSVGLSVGTAAVVALGLWAVGVSLPLALLLGGIAPATAPAATVAVLDELDATGPFATTVRSVVALDDVWGLLTYSLGVTAAAGVTGQGHLGAELSTAVEELGGSLLMGGGIGLVAAPFTGRIRPGKPTLLEALGLVALCAGLAEYLHLSPLLSALSMGAVIANLASHHELAFRQVEDLEWPVLVLFFVLAGGSLELGALEAAGIMLVGYVVLRFVGRFVGLGAASVATGRRDRAHLLWMPLALMPQAGVALGLALAAAERFPELSETLLSVVIGSTLVFEVIGPPLTRLAATRVQA